jgi:hypothetical protein
MSENKKTTMRMNESTKLEFRNKFKIYPSETDEEILVRLIKDEVSK